MAAVEVISKSQKINLNPALRGAIRKALMYISSSLYNRMRILTNSDCLLDICECLTAAVLLLSCASSLIYLSEQKRLETFSKANWDQLHNSSCKMQVMVGSGFFLYENDGVRCFFCNVDLKGWRQRGHPDEEHAKNSPFCFFLKSLRGIEFLQDLNTNLLYPDSYWRQDHSLLLHFLAQEFDLRNPNGTKKLMYITRKFIFGRGRFTLDGLKLEMRQEMERQESGNWTLFEKQIDLTEVFVAFNARIEGLQLRPLQQQAKRQMLQQWTSFLTDTKCRICLVRDSNVFSGLGDELLLCHQCLQNFLQFSPAARCVQLPTHPASGPPAAPDASTEVIPKSEQINLTAEQRDAIRDSLKYISSNMYNRMYGLTNSNLLLDICECLTAAVLLLSCACSYLFVSEQRRLESFSKGQWHTLGSAFTKEEMAGSGFYLCKYDLARCFFCNLGLSSWRQRKHPDEEHAKNSPFCFFLKSSRGVEFLQKLNQPLQYPDAYLRQDHSMLLHSLAQVFDMHSRVDDTQKLLCIVRQLFFCRQSYSRDTLKSVLRIEGKIRPPKFENQFNLASAVKAFYARIKSLQLPPLKQMQKQQMEQQWLPLLTDNKCRICRVRDMQLFYGMCGRVSLCQECMLRISRRSLGAFGRGKPYSESAFK